LVGVGDRRSGWCRTLFFADLTGWAAGVEASLAFAGGGEVFAAVVASETCLGSGSFATAAAAGRGCDAVVVEALVAAGFGAAAAVVDAGAAFAPASEGAAGAGAGAGAAAVETGGGAEPTVVELGAGAGAAAVVVAATGGNAGVVTTRVMIGDANVTVCGGIDGMGNAAGAVAPPAVPTTSCDIQSPPTAQQARPVHPTASTSRGRNRLSSPFIGRRRSST
jgi:hypothetical protein